MKDSLLEKVVSYMETWNMLQPGDSVVVGVSGGADSVCLLFLLYQISAEKNLDLHVVHVHHGIRESADEDASYVSKLCEKWSIPFHLVEEKVPKLAMECGCSEETAGRQVRYNAFMQLAMQLSTEQRDVKVAVAHHRQDNGETLLQHLFRGSGLRGLTGIAPVSRREEYVLIRPLLCLDREEIEEYLRERGMAWKTDETNASDAYSRNRIRHQILPVAEQIYPGAGRHLGMTAQELYLEEDFLQQATRNARKICCKSTEGGRYIFLQEEFAKLHIALQKRVILQVLEELSPTGRDMGQVQVSQVLELFEREGNRTVELPFGILAKRSYGEVEICGQEQGNKAAHYTPKMITRILSPSQWVGGTEGYLSDLKNPESTLLRDGVTECTKWFDCDKISGPVELRTRQPGDYFFVAGSDGNLHKKSVKQYMIDAKLPAEKRASIPVVAVGNHVLWIVGHRMSEWGKLSEGTKNILEITVRDKEGEENG